MLHRFINCNTLLYYGFLCSTFRWHHLLLRFHAFTCLPLMKDEILEVAGKIYKAGMSLFVIEDTEKEFCLHRFCKRNCESRSRCAMFCFKRYHLFFVCIRCLTQNVFCGKILLLAKIFGRCYLTYFNNNQGCFISLKEHMIF